MRRLLIVAVLAAAGLTLGGAITDRKAESMIAEASSLAEQGKYREALAALDAVESRLPWTDAADRVAEVRARVEQLASESGASEVVDERLPRAERDRREIQRQMEAVQNLGPDVTRPQEEAYERLQQQADRQNTTLDDFARRREEENRRMEQLRGLGDQ